MSKMKIAVLAGDGIGPEIMQQAIKVLHHIEHISKTPLFELQYGLVGGCAIDKYEEPLPKETRDIVSQSDAILFGAVGVWK